MTGEKFSIDWENFSSTSTERFRPLIREAKFSDVTLVTEDGQRLPSHQVILATGCTFFKKLLEEEANPKPLIFLRGVEANLLKPLINFLYTGQAEVDENVLANFLALADDLGVEGIENNCNFTQNEESESETANWSEIKDQNTGAGEKENTGLKGQETGAEEIEKTNGFDVKDQNTPSLDDVKKETNSKNIDLSCNLCSKTFDNESNLKKHHISHTQSQGAVSDSSKKIIVPKKDENGLHKCYYCERKIRDHCNFRRHIQSEHMMIILNCDHCNYRTRIASNLSRHKKKHVKNI